ncbi:MAG: protein phosphatase CheZ [Sulfuriflexus sp.]|nr:protein phosphatase CheZ [Sulfuriflexus sp.]
MDENISEDYLSKARSIITQVESGNMDEADKLVEELARNRDQSLFQELGKLTRGFHEALNGFKLDSKLTSLTGTDIPDARERLKHVIDVTDKAAHKTMSVVEDLMPLCETLGTQSDDIHERWKRFMKHDMEAKESRALCEEVQVYLSEQSSGTGRVRTGLSEILLAQDYQDITGQIISRVINLVTDLETSLVKLIKDSGAILDESTQASTVGELDGPQVPGLESSDAVSGQDEVDDLLSSLGF